MRCKCRLQTSCQPEEKCINESRKRKINGLKPDDMHFYCIKSEYIYRKEELMDENLKYYAKTKYNSGFVIACEIYRKVLPHCAALCP
ncbi:hypothetical protein ROD_13081 [Citrobacter rodentium ICC168]|uniref:Uncharacterized protein n=1 Tax=Citrobacter rodentium (strain ICC168) TaxID=637910 RepID=D2TGQ8_CITRI|nr:hypothetical protein ROD_13081 [Citrobacter rodentium ICC168]